VSGIDQLVVSASSRDAVTTAALNAQEILCEVGPSQVLARHVHEDLASRVRRIGDRCPLIDEAAPLIFHGSIGDDEVSSYVGRRTGPLVLQYHNITPPKFFETFDPAFGQLLALGRRQLTHLQHSVAGAFAVSEYNAADLEAMGYDDVRVVPLIIHTDRLRELPVSEATAEHLRAVVTGPLILCVAQLLPHKRVDLILQAYHLLVTHHLPEAHLVVVGAQRHQRYAENIVALAQDLRLPRCWLAGEVEDEVLAGLYDRADVLVVASAHEGVCVPLVEAMAFGLPIVARANAAIPETLGGAGLLLEGGAGPLLLAEALLAVLTDGRLRAELGRRSSERLAAFDPQLAKAALLTNLASVL